MKCSYCNRNLNYVVISIKDDTINKKINICCACLIKSFDRSLGAWGKNRFNEEEKQDGDK